jgi:hypothetical protein
MTVAAITLNFGATSREIVEKKYPNTTDEKNGIKYLAYQPFSDTSANIFMLNHWNKPKIRHPSNDPIIVANGRAIHRRVSFCLDVSIKIPFFLINIK